jgi:hypothetical protein
VYITAIELSGASDPSHISRVQWLQGNTGTAGTSSVPAFIEWFEVVPSRSAHGASKGGLSRVGLIRPMDGGGLQTSAPTLTESGITT